MTRSRPWLVVAVLTMLFALALGATYLLVREAAAPSSRTDADAGSHRGAAAPPPAPSSSTEPTPEPINPNAGDAGPSDGAEPASKTEQAQWEPVAVGFAKALVTDTDDARAWRSSLDRYSTPALKDQLATADPRRLPGGRYADHEVVQYDDTSAVVVATYSRSWAVAISVISDGERWKVYQYERWEG